MQARSRIGKDENSNFMKAHLKITSNIPAPNKYIINAAPSSKNYRVYAHDNRSYFADIQYQQKKEGIKASPFSYDPKPLLFRSQSATIKCHLKQSAERITLPMEA